MKKLNQFAIGLAAGLLSVSVPADKPASAPVVKPEPTQTTIPTPVVPAPAASAVNYDAAVAAYDAKDYSKAMALWLPLAETGNPQAQYAVGRLYEKGRGVEKDYATAAKWYHKAAEKSHADSQYRLAVAYGYGAGVKKNEVTGMSWLQKAAKNNQKRAQKSLSKAYEDGLFDMPRDPVQAKYWYDRSRSP